MEASSLRIEYLTNDVDREPGRMVTQSVDDACKLSQIYVTPIQRTISASMRGGESWILRYVGMLLLGE